MADDVSLPVSQSPDPTIREDDGDRRAEPVDVEQPPRLPFPVVGIGASAGGLEAIIEFLAAMPADGGMAFVLVQHLAPDRESMMAEILAKRTAMPVSEVEDGTRVEANRVYVIRPGRVLTLRDGRLRLGPALGGPRAANRPIDDFFKSLADEQRERSIAIIMSGMGSNGTAGAQTVKAVGGLCVAQEPESAQFPSMPRHLIDSGSADYILRPGEMPDVLLAYAGHPYARGERGADAATLIQRNENHLRDVLTVLRNRTRTDFGGYKKPTVLRRVQRRMGLARVAEMGEYLKLLRQSPGEVAALADDLLIHVTGFFRDPGAWETLRSRVIVPLVAARAPDEPLRCWVAACATGDEAYTLAILITEEMERVEKSLDVKIFATDMAERTLGLARAGVYPGGIEAEVTPERLARFFVKEDAVYRIRPEIRERVVFAPQNVLQDPPFSRLDIATCRNLLIYLEPDVQRRVLGLLHFGLRDGGTLFLGTSETVVAEEGMFEPVDKRAKIFRRIGPTRHGTVEFPLPAGLREARHRDATGSGERIVPGRRTAAGSPTLAQVTQHTLLERHLPAAVLLDRDYRILFFHGNTRPFLRQPAGEPTRDFLTLAVEGVRAAGRAAIRRAAAGGATVTVPDGWVETESGARARVLVTASPAVDAAAADQFVLSFDVLPVATGGADVATAGAGDGAAAADAAPDAAEELRRVRDELHSANEELQTTNEEMRAAAEEASSVNEELQSTNEELETSKEEMQSLNEELNTVNAQLHAKMEELQATGNDLASLLTSTDLAVLFLDPRMRIRRFTPPMRDLLELLASDAGRPLSDFAPKFSDPDLDADARAVLEKLIPVERQIESAAGRSLLRRITPYRTADDRIDGVVVTFFDVTAQTRTAARLAETARLLDLSNDAIIVRDKDNRITYWNHGAAETFGYTADEAVGQDIHELLRTEYELPLEELTRELHEHDRHSGEVVQVTRDGRALTLLCRWSLDRDAQGNPASILTTSTDITARKQAEAAIAQARAEAEAANGMKDEFLATLSHELRTPLAAILLWTENLRAHIRGSQPVAEAVDAIRSSAEAQRELIEDLLDTSRIASGKVRLLPRDVDPARLVRESVDAAQPTADAKGVTLAAMVDDKIGTVWADPDRLRQIVWNLLSNAIKFTPEGGRIEASLRRRGRQIEFRVQDNGEGITADFLPHVFTPFRQADSSISRRHAGLGLGLAICQKLAQLHGGTIRAESAGPGRGAAFTVRLPLRPGPPSSSESSGSPHASAAGLASPENATHVSLSGLRVLLVEDDAGTRDALATLLRAADADVVAAVGSATAAMEVVERAPLDVLLCDIGLPGTDGTALIQLIRKREQSRTESDAEPLPAIALSAFTREQDVRSALEAGFNQFLGKPVDTKTLLATLARLAATTDQ